MYVAYADTTAPYAAYKPTDEDITTAPDGSITPAEQSMGPLVAGPSMSSVRAEDAGAGDPFDFHGRARTAFTQGDYRSATYMAAHAVVDEPKNPEVHLLYSLGLFSLGEYRGAAMECHAVASLGKTPDWETLYAFYGKVDPYTAQLRTLEKYVHKNARSPEGRFLLGFHYLMAGHPDEAKVELLEALKLAPRDRLAARLLKEAGGTVPPEIAKQQAELPPPVAPKSTLPDPPKPELGPAEQDKPDGQGGSSPVPKGR
ncbi:MAG: hypothetical protein LLG00_01255 [Planctomycetaceae bacterium]|nr:hypothetical protein [Planctomycetaceae bacterium]